MGTEGTGPYDQDEDFPTQDRRAANLRQGFHASSDSPETDDGDDVNLDSYRRDRKDVPSEPLG